MGLEGCHRLVQFITEMPPSGSYLECMALEEVENRFWGRDAERHGDGFALFRVCTSALGANRLGFVHAGWAIPSAEQKAGDASVCRRWPASASAASPSPSRYRKLVCTEGHREKEEREGPRRRRWMAMDQW